MKTELIQIWCGSNQPKAISGAKVIKMPECEMPTIAADYERFQRATMISNMVYADFDIEPQEGFFEYFKNLKPGRPHFAFWHSVPECCLFAVNGCTEFFELLLREKDEKNIPDCYSWTFKVLKYHIDDVYIIPKSIYIHRHNTFKKINPGYEYLI